MPWWWALSAANEVAQRYREQDRHAADRGLDDVAAHTKDSLPAP
jgi:hypothetical protein